MKKVLISQVNVSFFLVIKLSDVVIILLINVRNANNYWYFNIYEHDKFHAQFN